MLPIISWSFYKKMGDLVFIASVLVWLVIEESVEKFIEYLEGDEWVRPVTSPSLGFVVLV